MLLNSLDEVRDTILHEIAHALEPHDKHGPRWKAKCIEIGAKPTRCYTEAHVVSPPRAAAPYQLGCQRCGWWIDRRRIAWQRTLSCRKCREGVIYRETATGKLFVVERVTPRVARVRMLSA